MQIVANKNGKLTMKVGKSRCGVTVSAGPWVDGVPAELIKVRARTAAFPAEVRSLLAVENNSDMREDYFEADSLRLMPGHPLYAAAAAHAA